MSLRSLLRGANKAAAQPTFERTLTTLAKRSLASRPQLFDLSKESDRDAFDALVKKGDIRSICDDFEEQHRELFAIRDPALAHDPGFAAAFERHYAELAKGKPLWQQGKWVFFPWCAQATHVLDEPEFFAVRTARNRDLITEDEQRRYYEARVGICGLSVGSSLAFALALQGGSKRMKLADFDRLALSNTNRILAGADRLGAKKVEIAARTIYELNPYAEIDLYPDGLRPENIAAFFEGLDIVADEVDDLSIKYLIREQARRHRIAVVMGADNGDNAVLDVERYDLDAGTPFFHGTLEDASYESLRGLGRFETGRLITKLVGPEHVTERMQQSLLAMGKTIVSWPQLGGAALLNGAALACCIRRIVCGQPLFPDRAVVSLDEKLIPGYDTPEQSARRKSVAEEFARMFDLPARATAGMPQQHLREILEAAIRAPSGENCQPWRFVVKGTSVELWNRPERDQSLYNWGQRASYMANGAALENLVLAAGARGFGAEVSYFPDLSDENHVATVRLASGKGSADPLAEAIFRRVSNRKPYNKAPLAENERAALAKAFQEGGYGRLQLFEEREDIERLARLGATNEEVMLSNDILRDFFLSHLTWTKEEDERKRVGFYVETLEAPAPARVVFRLLRFRPAARLLQGIGFHKAAAKQNSAVYASAAAAGVIFAEGKAPADFVKSGRALERVWLAAEFAGLSLQPLSGLLFLKLKVDAGERGAFSQDNLDAITRAFGVLKEAAGVDAEHAVFAFRLGKAPPPSARALRFPLEDSVSYES